MEIPEGGGSGGVEGVSKTPKIKEMFEAKLEFAEVLMGGRDILCNILLYNTPYNFYAHSHLVLKCNNYSIFNLNLRINVLIKKQALMKAQEYACLNL